jgi:hypothetical protein
MKQTINFSQFTDQFQAVRPDNFTYEGLRALYDYFEKWGEDCGGDIELDVIAISCEFTEYEDLEGIQANYSDIEDITDLRNHTRVIEFDTGIIIQDY